ncbi:LOW QUALITY PROTEIN: putative sodium-coupled neutral amino acid transporter 10 [Drosophila tropicalis]|uniref:LOW QUALITY PROTEIN: putative sodium-coupled neutral amino acid transporter 10 n=1 Tax=Drosophila tropicalis TaxID=46794 RepID=UPI0035ABA8CD
MFSHSSHVMTLANSIIGVGILAMPFCFQKCGIILSILLLILSNGITRICCHYLIKTSLLTRRKSFELLGLHAFGTSGKLLVELCIIGYLIGTCITYFVVVGDLGPQIVAKIFNIDADSPRLQTSHLRIGVMLVITLICILPLGMLRNVDSLSAVCTASIGFYLCLMLKIVLESETHISANDWTSKVLYWEPSGVLQCLPIFSMALSCQMQLFEVFESINNQSLDKLNGIVRNATWICTLVYIAVGFFGYVAFCTYNFSGNILVNLSPSFGSDIIKIGFVLSIAFSFPLVIFPCRASIYSLLYRKGHTESSSYIPEQRFRFITIFIVGFSLCVALVIPSVELIIGLVGSTIGVAICIMFPASSFRKIIKKDSSERTLAQFVFVSGFCLMVLGTYANLNAIDEKSSGPEFDVGQIVTPLTVINAELPKHLAKDVDQINNPNPVDPILEVKTLEDSIKTIKELEEKPLAKASSESPPLPPLPEDETHGQDSETVDKKVEKNRRGTLNQGKASGDSYRKQAPENIDKAAIKKEEEITAEEQKESKARADELAKTKNELKKTKELLERTVDELNDELAKQKQVQPAPEPEMKPEPQAKPKSASLIEILTENAHAREEKEAHAKVFEPLSYKQGELMKNASAKIKIGAAAGSAPPPELVKRLPLPLALLVNVTHSQPVVGNASLNGENVEAIRRELLHLKIEKEMTTLTPPHHAERIKREASEQKQENCLPEPKLKEINAGPAALSLHIENIGRDLKSLDEHDEDATTSIVPIVNTTSIPPS